tara:strand:- start:7502 stop:8299 length:798 start_codon:yes stop_codon:yes gene_type:complete
MKFKHYKIRTKLSNLPYPLVACLALFFVITRLIIRKKIILIMTPGKVGSSSLYYSLLRKTNFCVFHIHYISKIRILKEFNLERDSSKGGASWHLYVSYWINLFIKWFKFKYKLILLVRKGSSRYLSSVFQNLNQMPKNVFNQKTGFINYPELKKTILNGVNEDITNINDYIKFELGYFKINDNELKINETFAAKGGDDVEILYTTLFQTDPLLYINSFLGTKINRLERANVGKDKFYSEEYKEMKKDIELITSPKYYALDSKLGF